MCLGILPKVGGLGTASFAGSDYNLCGQDTERGFFLTVLHNDRVFNLQDLDIRLIVLGCIALI